VATDHTARANVLAIRGSVSAANWAADGRWGVVPCPQYGGEGSKCNDGYIAVWNDCKKQAMDLMNKAIAQNPSYESVVTGHSLGATAAVYAVADVRAGGKEAKLVCCSCRVNLNLTTHYSTPTASRAQATSSSQNGSATKRVITESHTQPTQSATHRPKAAPAATHTFRPSTGSRAGTGMRMILWCWKD
jgi:alpha-beta hydrolase superfamily lysophospholipase